MAYPRIIPHQDGAGVIERVGAGVDPARVGERVWLYMAQRDGSAFGTAVSIPKTSGKVLRACQPQSSLTLPSHS
jgi:NADPH:quinone reductase-like Zn-dependent oxidoreductase